MVIILIPNFKKGIKNVAARMSRSHRKDIFRTEQAGTAYILGLIRGL